MRSHRWRVSLSIALWSYLGIASAQGRLAGAPFEDTLAQRVLACTGCHGDRGAGVADPAFPRIAGQAVEALRVPDAVERPRPLHRVSFAAQLAGRHRRGAIARRRYLAADAQRYRSLPID